MLAARRLRDALAILRHCGVRRLAQAAGLLPASAYAATILVSLFVLPPAFAVEESARERIKAVVQQQLRAFQADDGASAYALASPAIRRMFPSSDVFMDMVRQGYQPLYRSREHTFGEVRDTESGLEQVVRIEDADGVGWTAIYSLEHEPDGSWAISGCRLVRAPDQAV